MLTKNFISIWDFHPDLRNRVKYNITLFTVLDWVWRMYVLWGDIKSIIDPLNYYNVEYYDVIHLLSISFAIFGDLISKSEEKKNLLQRLGCVI